MAKTIEEKAKAYDKALATFRESLGKHELVGVNRGFLESIFSELKESEDENIRKEIIDFIKNSHNYWQPNDSIAKKWVSWLEKQGEQEWSVNDENTMKYLQFIVDFFDTNPGTKEGLKKWLESIKDRIIPQKQWKPTKAQLDALEFVIEGNIISNIYVLKDLLNKLKTL